MFKMDLEKAEKPETKLPTSTESSKKQESSRKTSTSALLTPPKPLTVKSVESSERGGTPAHLTCPLRNLHEGQGATVRASGANQQRLVPNEKRSTPRFYIVTLII